MPVSTLERAVRDDGGGTNWPRLGPRDLPHDGAAAGTALEESLGHQSAVHRRHRVARDAELGGQLARGGQPVARREPAAQDPVAELREQGTRRTPLLLWIEEQVHCDHRTPFNLVWKLSKSACFGPYTRPSICVP